MRKTPIATSGAMNSTIHASTLATASSVSPENNEACAGEAANNATGTSKV